MNDFIAIIVVGFVVIFSILFGANKLKEMKCANNITEMGREYRYDLINGCRVQQKDGTFIYWKMYKSVNQ